MFIKVSIQISNIHVLKCLYRYKVTVMKFTGTNKIGNGKRAVKQIPKTTFCKVCDWSDKVKCQVLILVKARFH